MIGLQKAVLLGPTEVGIPTSRALRGLGSHGGQGSPRGIEVVTSEEWDHDSSIEDRGPDRVDPVGHGGMGFTMIGPHERRGPHPSAPRRMRVLIEPPDRVGVLTVRPAWVGSMRDGPLSGQAPSPVLPPQGSAPHLAGLNGVAVA